MRRSFAAACAALYCFTMIGLIGGIGVMASGVGAAPQKSGSGVGFALIMLLRD